MRAARVRPQPLGAYQGCDLTLARYILLVVAIAGATSSAVADPWIAPQAYSGGFSDSPAAGSADGQGAARWLDECLVRESGCDPSVAASTPTNPTADVPDDVWQLPAPPASSSLFVSALLSAGAFHLARKARHAHLAHLPAWYHEACPERIGHAVAFDFDLADMPVCFTAEIAPADAPDETPALHEYLRESHSRIESQFILPVIAPRGPPSLV